jgi:hypothetical protein
MKSGHKNKDYLHTEVNSPPRRNRFSLKIENFYDPIIDFHKVTNKPKSLT